MIIIYDYHLIREEYFHKHSNELKFDALSYKSKCKAFNVVKLEVGR